MGFRTKPSAGITLPTIALPTAPSLPRVPLAGGGGALAGHTFSPGHDAGMGGGVADASLAIHQSREGRAGFGNPRRGRMPGR